MSAAVAEQPLTYEEERGKPMPGQNPSIVQTNLALELSCDRAYRVQSELTLKLAEKPDLTPDLCVFPRKPVDFSRDQLRVLEPPLMAVEILSPTQTLTDLLEKSGRLLAHGVKSVWIVLPVLQQVTVVTAEDKRSFLEGVVTDPATGLQADLAAVFS